MRLTRRTRPKSVEARGPDAHLYPWGVGTGHPAPSAQNLNRKRSRGTEVGNARLPLTNLCFWAVARMKAQEAETGASLFAVGEEVDTVSSQR